MAPPSSPGALEQQLTGPPGPSLQVTSGLIAPLSRLLTTSLSQHVTKGQWLPLSQRRDPAKPGHGDPLEPGRPGQTPARQDRGCRGAEFTPPGGLRLPRSDRAGMQEEQRGLFHMFKEKKRHCLAEPGDTLSVSLRHQGAPGALSRTSRSAAPWCPRSISLPSAGAWKLDFCEHMAQPLPPAGLSPR